MFYDPLPDLNPEEVGHGEEEEIRDGFEGFRSYSFRNRRSDELVASMNSKRFKRTFRVSTTLFDHLENFLSPMLAGVGSSNGKSLQPREKLLVFLAFVGHNLNYITISGMFEISMGSVSNIIHQVIQVLFVHRKEFIRLPTAREARTSADKFSRLSGFPPLLFAIMDGTHIPVLAPKEDDGSYRNRKGWTSINSLVVTDAEHKFIFASTNAPGCAHDCRVLKKSGLYQAYQINQELPFEGALVGADSGYYDYIP